MSIVTKLLGIDSAVEKRVEEKLNPSQFAIAMDEGKYVTGFENNFSFTRKYESLEIVNRGVNMLVDDVARIPIAVGESVKTGNVSGMRKKTLSDLLSFEPNPFQPAKVFWKQVVIDIIMNGNSFIYFDGKYLYVLPAEKITIETSTTKYVKAYIYEEAKKSYLPDEIIHIKDNSFRSMYRGTSRLKSASNSMQVLQNMIEFQNNFFKNGAVIGLAISTPNSLSDKIKEKTLRFWAARYKPNGGGRAPMILDNGTKIETIGDADFQKLGFEESISGHEQKILKALGIPPILMEGGNNANIRPNLRLYYLQTVVPIMENICDSLQFFFGYKVYPDLVDVTALQPEMREVSAYHTGLTNGGITTGMEARRALGLDDLPEDHEDYEMMNRIRVPANIAGSAFNPDEGGRPQEDTDE